MQIFVGNLAFAAKEQDVYQLFLPFGKISFVKIIMEKKGDKSRGFGFLEMPDDAEAVKAIEALNAKEFLGRPLKLEPARSLETKEPRPPKKRNKQPEAKPEIKAKPSKPYFKRTGGYKGGRRSESFAKKRAEKGETGPLPERKPKENPMRWRKAKPWQKKKAGGGKRKA